MFKRGLIILLVASVLLNIKLLFFNNQDGSYVTVSEVVDGDTVITETNHIRMRLANIEVPELAYCGGSDAKDELEKLVEGKKVKIVSNNEDVYNRSIVFLYEGNNLINEILLSKGLVRYEGSPSPKRDILYKAYKEAYEEKKGIFGPPCRSETPDKAGCAIKGNTEKNTGTKRYLTPSCSEYKRTMVEKDLGEKWFCTEEEAQKEGFVKAANCK